MTMTAKSIVNITGLNKWYGDFHVLRDINLDVAKGERIVICGPSGSGKSTLIRCINALEEFQEGQIVVDGIELGPNLRRVDEVRREVGMVFQSFNLFPHLTVLENCTLAPIWVRNIPKKEAEAAAMKYLERVKIPHQANKYPGQMSGGQQQRVAIARALTMNPKVMLFDEPRRMTWDSVRGHPLRRAQARAPHDEVSDAAQSHLLERHVDCAAVLEPSRHRQFFGAHEIRIEQL